MKSIQLVVIMNLVAICTAFGQTQAVKNDGDKPQGVIEVYLDGKAVAGLYVLPHETMSIRNQNPTSGAGYYEALTNNYFPVQSPGSPIMIDENIDFPKLRVDKVEWDHNGKLTSILGLRPTLFREIGSSIAITSDVKKPKIVDGKLYIKLEGHGDADYAVEIQFGKIISIEKQGADKK